MQGLSQDFQVEVLHDNMYVPGKIFKTMPTIMHVWIPAHIGMHVAGIYRVMVADQRSLTNWLDLSTIVYYLQDRTQMSISASLYVHVYTVGLLYHTATHRL